MNFLLIAIVVILFIYIITTIKLYDCGLTFPSAISITLRLHKLIFINLEIFFKSKDENLQHAIQILLLPLKYKHYLEFLACIFIDYNSTIEYVEEIAPTLNKNGRNRINKYLKSHGMSIKVDRSNKIVRETINTSLNKKGLDPNNSSEIKYAMLKAFA